MKKLLLSIIIGISWLTPVIPMEMEYETEVTDQDDINLKAELQKLFNEYLRLRRLERNNIMLDQTLAQFKEYRINNLKEPVLLLRKNKNKLVAQIKLWGDNNLYVLIGHLSHRIFDSFYDLFEQ